MTTTPAIVAWLKAQLATIEGRTLCTELQLSLNSKGQFCLSGWLNYNGPHPTWCSGVADNLNAALDDLNREASTRQKLINDMVPLEEVNTEALKD